MTMNPSAKGKSQVATVVKRATRVINTFKNGRKGRGTL